MLKLSNHLFFLGALVLFLMLVSFGRLYSDRDPDSDGARFDGGVNPTSTSTNPLFKDGVKQRLQCPPEFIDVYVDEVPPEKSLQLQAHLRRCVIEILKRYNPNRRLTEVYPAFIAAEKWYHANADPERAGSERKWGANRIDWFFQSLLDFPEILVLLEEDLMRATAMYEVEMGNLSRDWNLLQLPDGRTFRADYHKFYKFTTGDVYKFEKPDGTMVGKHEVVLYFGISGADAELVKTNLNTITDAELESLQGWNYNINPYTTGLYKLGDNKSREDNFPTLGKRSKSFKLGDNNGKQ